MTEHNCEKCRFRARYDANQKSFLGRIWRWHINWCPGWKSYTGQLSEQEKEAVIEKYSLTR